MRADGNDQGEQLGRNIATLQSTFAALLREVQELVPEDRRLLIDQTFLLVSSAIAYARMCAAGLVCANRVSASSGEAPLRAEITGEFFETFRRAWLTSVATEADRAPSE